MNVISRDAACLFFNRAKCEKPGAVFRLMFFRHDGTPRDMVCNFSLDTAYPSAVFAGKVTVWDLVAQAPKTFRMDRLALIAIDDKVWLIENERGEIPRVHTRHLEMMK